MGAVFNCISRLLIGSKFSCRGCPDKVKTACLQLAGYQFPVKSNSSDDCQSSDE